MAALDSTKKKKRRPPSLGSPFNPQSAILHSMPATITTLNAWSSDWTTLVVAVVWQSTLLAAVVGLIALMLRGSSPAVRYWLWQIVAIKLLLIPVWSWPVWSLPVSVPWSSPQANPEPAKGVSTAEPAMLAPLETQSAPHESPVLTSQPVEAVAEPANAWPLADLTWRSWLLIGWAAIVGLQIARLLWQRGRLARMLRGANPADGALLQVVAELAQALQLKRIPQTMLTADECSPFVCGILRPTLVLPRTLTVSLTTAELRQVIAHELAHIKRRDLVWSWIPEVARMIYFFHPVAHWVAWRVRLERELACDQWAIVASGNSPGEYAQTLVRVVSHVSQPAALRAAIAPLTGGGDSGGESHE